MIRSLLFLCLTLSLACGGLVVSEEAVCDLCLDAIKDAEAAVSDQSIFARLVTGLERVCDAVSTDMKEECSATLKGLNQEALQQLLMNMDPMDMCAAMTACPVRSYAWAQDVPRNVQPVADFMREEVDECELCQLLVGTIDTLLKNKTTRQVANATAYRLCELLPPNDRDDCIVFVPLIVDMLTEGVDPAGACTNIGLCMTESELPVQNEPALEEERSELPREKPFCSVCELLVQTVDQFLLENKTEAAINATVYKLCNALPDSVKATCLSVAPLVVSELSKGADPKTACTFLGLCQSSGIVAPSFPDVSDKPYCAVCELLVKTVDQYLEENKTEAAINSTVYKLCNALPDSIKADCLKVAPIVVSTLHNGVDPEEACQFLTLCDPTGPQVQQPVKVEAKREGEDTLCAVCELLVQTVDKYLKENKTEAAINATVYRICNALPASIKGTCLSVAPMVVSALVGGIDPKIACTALRLCNASGIEIMPPRTMDPKGREMRFRERAGPACEVCELIVDAVDQYLKENSTFEFVNSTVYKLCNDVPDSFKGTCLSVAPLIVSTLSNGVDPKTACTFAKLCDSSDSNRSQRKIVEKSAVSAEPVCELCELMIEALDEYLKENRTSAAINSTVYQLCNVLPGELKSMCLSFAPQLVAALSNGVDPKEACIAVKLCATTEKTMRMLTAMRDALVSKKHIDWCTVCKDHVGIIDKDLYKDECLKAADTKFPKIWESFLNGTGSADNVCKLLGACTN
ncbi:hypothetical protein ACOMHN_015801 [Nucella lapillus]